LKTSAIVLAGGSGFGYAFPAFRLYLLLQYSRKLGLFVDPSYSKASPDPPAVAAKAGWPELDSCQPLPLSDHTSYFKQYSGKMGSFRSGYIFYFQ
jgi:hypothetical protein